MSMGQKEAVVAEVMAQIPTFRKNIDNALLLLSAAGLEQVKLRIQIGIQVGNIEYSKDPSNLAEVRPYARSMVMNHLKKAKELNGGNGYVSTTTNGQSKTVRVKEKIAPKGVNVDLLPEELKEYVKTLV